MTTKHYDVIVIGAGPAGMTAGIYLARAKKSVLILSEGIAGGQMILTHEVANYPGVEHISGYMLGRTMQKQAEEFGCEFLTNIEIANLVLTSGEKSAELKTGEKFTAKAIILATGGKSRTLGVTGEKELTGRGISYCATCDGDFFTDKEIIVVGGGNSAVEEAVALTKYASKVTIVHQFDHFQAYPGALEEARRNEKIHFLTESVVTEFRGDNSVEHAVIKNIKTDTETVMKTDGAFIFIGYVPQTQMFEGKIELNERKEVLTDDNLQTSAEGVFAAGDLRNKKHRQITTAVSDGTVAALNAIDYIHSKA